MLKKLCDINYQPVSVNPDFVTLIKEIPERQGVEAHTEIWVVSDAGYHTSRIRVRESVESVTDYLNKS